MKKFIPLIVVALFALMIGSAGAQNFRWAIGINKSTERAHSYAERLVESDEEVVGYDRPECHHTRFPNGKINYSDVKCDVPMRVDGGGYRDYTYHRWATRDASGHIITWESFGPTPAYATGFVPVPPRSQGH